MSATGANEFTHTGTRNITSATRSKFFFYFKQAVIFYWSLLASFNALCLGSFDGSVSSTCAKRSGSLDK